MLTGQTCENAWTISMYFQCLFKYSEVLIVPFKYPHLGAIDCWLNKLVGYTMLNLCNLMSQFVQPIILLNL